MKKFFLFLLYISFFQCGKEPKPTEMIDDNPITQTPAIPTVEEQKASIDENLLGKWSFVNNAKKSTNCQVEEIQFFDGNLYSLSIIKNSEGNDPAKLLYRGKFDLHHTETNGTLSLTKVVLMENDYVPGDNPPTNGSVATLSDIELEESALGLSIQLEIYTEENCGAQTSANLNANKAENIAPNAPENSNHQLIQQEWRWIGLFDVGEGDRSPATPRKNLCDYLEQGFDQRCRTTSGEIIADCPQIGTVTILYSAYGTVLVSYFDPTGKLFYARQDYWRWKEDDQNPYSALEYRLENQTFEEAGVTRHLIEIDETTMALQVSGVHIDNGEEYPWTVQDSYQLGSLTYSSCPEIIAKK